MQNNNTFFANKTKIIKEGRGCRLSKRLNEKFLDCYMVTDRLCCSKFGIGVGGVTEYINRLNNAKNLYERGDILPKLLRYRGIRNKFAHEAGAIRRSDEISRSDIKWIKDFNRELARKKDPISQHLKRERKSERHKKARRIIFAVAIGIIAALALALYFVLQKG